MGVEDEDTGAALIRREADQATKAFERGLAAQRDIEKIEMTGRVGRRIEGLDAADSDRVLASHALDQIVGAVRLVDNDDDLGVILRRRQDTGRQSAIR